MSLIDTRNGRPGPGLMVPDNPWSTVYRPEAIRAAAMAITEGLSDEEAWRAYLDAGHHDTEATRALAVAAAVHGARFGRKARAKRSR